MSHPTIPELRLPIPASTQDRDAATVAQNLRQLVLAVAQRCDAGVVIPLGPLARPRTILGALEAFSWGRKLGVAVTHGVADSVEALLDLDARDVLADPRLTRLWALAMTLIDGDALERRRPTAEHLSTQLAVVESGGITGQDELDRAIAALLLHSLSCGPDWAPAIVPELLDGAVAACDPVAVSYLLGYGTKAVIEASAVRRKSWLEFFASMTPRSMPFGWISSVRGQTIDAVDHEIAALVALLGLQAAGLARVAGEQEVLPSEDRPGGSSDRAGCTVTPGQKVSRPT